MIDHPPVDVVESFLADFEAAWAAMKVGNSQAPRIEDYLPPPGHPAHLAILIELACIDLERSWEQGRRPEPEAYFQRFPILAEDADGRGQLAFEDYRQRLLAGLAPRPEDYRQRFDIDVADWPLEASAIGNGRSRSAGSGFSRGLFDKAFPTRRVPVEVIADLGRTRTHRQGNADRLEQARARLPRSARISLAFSSSTNSAGAPSASFSLRARATWPIAWSPSRSRPTGAPSPTASLNSSTPISCPSIPPIAAVPSRPSACPTSAAPPSPTCAGPSDSN